MTLPDNPINENLLRDCSMAMPLPEETMELIAQGEGMRIERIVSFGHASDEDFWYDCDQREWVSVLSGEGKLRFEGRPDLVHMKPGDHLIIDAHERHRVEWTSPSEPTIWLAVYFPPSQRADE
ncbi:MAG: cupin domain-containing protein [Rubripirellula sp.]